MAHDPIIERLAKRYEHLLQQDDKAFVRQVHTYLATIDEDERAAEVVRDLRRESDKAASDYNDEHDALVAVAVDIRQRLAGDAPEIDDSNLPPPDQSSRDYAFWKIDSMGGFDRTARESERIGYSPMPYYDVGDRSTVQRLIQILRGRVLAAEFGVQNVGDPRPAAR